LKGRCRGRIPLRIAAKSRRATQPGSSKRVMRAPPLLRDDPRQLLERVSRNPVPLWVGTRGDGRSEVLILCRVELARPPASTAPDALPPVTAPASWRARSRSPAIPSPSPNYKSVIDRPIASRTGRIGESPAARVPIFAAWSNRVRVRR
jgi:hypothetical protein